MNVAFHMIQFFFEFFVLLNFDKKNNNFQLWMYSSNLYAVNVMVNGYRQGIQSITSIANRNCHFCCVLLLLYICFCLQTLSPVAEHCECSAAAFNNNKHFICNFTTSIHRMELNVHVCVRMSVCRSGRSMYWLYIYIYICNVSWPSKYCLLFAQMKSITR